MAHWIIEDRGFGGQYYRCSECRESWCDIYTNVSREDKCPNCGASINDDDNVYLDRNPFRTTYSTVSSTIRKYDELDTKLFQLTGYSIEQLVELFAAGYTLEPPCYKYRSMAELEEEE